MPRLPDGGWLLDDSSVEAPLYSARAKKYDDSQPRDENGRWASSGEGVREYVSPRERALSDEESEVRRVAYALKLGDKDAIRTAAEAMAQRVPRGAILIPVPSSSGDTKANLALAAAIAERAEGSSVADVLRRKAPVESSSVRRVRGGRGIEPEEHGMQAGDVPGGKPVVFVDNVITSGSTFEAARRAVGRGKGIAWAKGKDVLLPARETAAKSDEGAAEEVLGKNCGTGAGGFQEGNTCGGKDSGGSDKLREGRDYFARMRREHAERVKRLKDDAGDARVVVFERDRPTGAKSDLLLILHPSTYEGRKDKWQLTSVWREADGSWLPSGHEEVKTRDAAFDEVLMNGLTFRVTVKKSDLEKAEQVVGDLCRGEGGQFESCGSVSVSDDPEKWKSISSRWKSEKGKSSMVGEFKDFVLYHAPGFSRGEGYVTAEDDSGNVAGTVFYAPRSGARIEGAVEVRPDSRRKGLASAMYEKIEELTGKKMTPAPSHTPGAAALWSSGRRKFGKSEQIEGDLCRGEGGQFESCSGGAGAAPAHWTTPDSSGRTKGRLPDGTEFSGMDSIAAAAAGRDRLGAAAYVDAETGEFVGVHVTSNPDRAEEALREGKDIADTRDRDKFGDIGPGLYMSAAPQLWTGRATEKWSFADKVTPEQRGKIANKVRDVLFEHRKDKYITQGELENGLRDLRNWRKIPGMVPIFLADQPYNIKWWEPEFLEPLGVTPGKQPAQVTMRVRGRFVDAGSLKGLSSFTPEMVESLKAGGWVGAYAEGGFSAYPQLVVWDKRGVTKFGGWSRYGDKKTREAKKSADRPITPWRMEKARRKVEARIEPALAHLVRERLERQKARVIKLVRRKIAEARVRKAAVVAGDLCRAEDGKFESCSGGGGFAEHQEARVGIGMTPRETQDRYWDIHDSDAVTGWRRGMSTEQRESLRKYAGGAYWSMNNVLRGREPVTREFAAAYAELRRVVENAPKMDEPVKVFRGLTFHGDDADVVSMFGGHVGKEVRLAGLQSASLSLPVAERFAGGKRSVVLEIETDRGAVVGDLGPRGEFEILLGHAWKYRVEGVDAEPGKQARVRLKVVGAWSPDDAPILKAERGRDGKFDQPFEAVEFLKVAEKAEDGEKFKRVGKLEGKLAGLRAAVAKDLGSKDERTREIAAVVALIDQTYMRIGGSDSEEETGSVGATSLRVKHVALKDGSARLRFDGKSGVAWDRTVTDKALVGALKASAEGKKPGDYLFGVSAPAVNEYLQGKAGITSKDFRTYHATRLAGELLSRAGAPKDAKDAAAKIKDAVERTAEQLNHTPGVSRSTYIEPGVIAEYEAKVPGKTEKADGGNCGTGSGGFQEGNTCSRGAAHGEGAVKTITADELRETLPKSAKGNQSYSGVGVDLIDRVHEFDERVQDGLRAVVVRKDGGRVYLYSGEHKERAAKAKFAKAEKFAEAVDGVRERISADIVSEDARTREAAVVSALIDDTYMRVGGGRTEARTGSVGATTLRASHVTEVEGGLKFSFPGKSGVAWERVVTDPDLVAAVRRQVSGKAPHERVFSVDRQGVNAYLKRVGGVTAKDFRTYHASRIVFEELARASAPANAKEAKATMKAAIEKAAAALGHTPGVSKSTYVNPVILERFLERVPAKRKEAA